MDSYRDEGVHKGGRERGTKAIKRNVYMYENIKD